MNIASGKTWTYGYDHRNQLISAEERTTDGGTLEQKVEFKYDVRGLRQEKKVDTNGNGTFDTTQKYAYDGWKTGPMRSFVGLENHDVFADLDGSGSLTTRYVRGDAIDQVFARLESNGDPYWYLTDHLGSIRDVTDEAGAVVKTVAYDAFGNILSESGTGELGRYAFTGREIEVELALQFNRERYYDPQTGRWISRDPLGFDAGDSNLYRYVRNQPTMWTDPSGLGGIFGIGMAQGEDHFNGIRAAERSFADKMIKNPVIIQYHEDGLDDPQAARWLNLRYIRKTQMDLLVRDGLVQHHKGSGSGEREVYALQIDDKRIVFKFHRGHSYVRGYEDHFEASQMFSANVSMSALAKDFESQGRLYNALDTGMTFGLHLLPGGATADYWKNRGDVEEAAASAVADIGAFLTFGATKARKVAGLVMTGGVIGYRSYTAGTKFAAGKIAEGAGDVGEIVLRVVTLGKGVKALRSSLRNAPATPVTRGTASTPTDDEVISQIRSVPTHYGRGFSRPRQRPSNAPSGTRAIDEHSQTRDIVHQIKDNLVEDGVGATSYVGIAPNGDVIVTNPNGTAANLGNWEQYAN